VVRRRRRLRPGHDAGLLDDARHLALEVSGLAPPAAVDVMALGVVLEPGEVPRRLIDVWSHFRQDGQWMNLVHCGCLVTDRRLLLRLPSGELASLWWSGVVGLDVDLPNGRVVLDYGDGRPRAVSGPAVPAVAVMAVASLYGFEALATHPGIAPLRQHASALRA
jgi:hypothetical protein